MRTSSSATGGVCEPPAPSSERRMPSAASGSGGACESSPNPTSAWSVLRHQRVETLQGALGLPHRGLA